MGGAGSGNHYHWWRGAKKTTVADCLQLDANCWMREGILKAGVHLSGLWEWTYRSGRECSINYELLTLDPAGPRLRLSYSVTRNGSAQPELLDYEIGLTSTRLTFGGLRWWFVCPLVVDGRPCNRRVAKLYLPPRARYFGCRQCHDLTYKSCQESHKNDALSRLMARELGEDFDNVKRVMQLMG